MVASKSGADFKQFVFIILMAAAAVVLLFFSINLDFVASNLPWLVLGIAIIYLVSRFDYIIQLKDFERAVIFTFGRVTRVGGPGWALVFPPFETHSLVDLRTHVIDTPKQDVVTNDNIEVAVDAAIYLRVNKDNASVINSVVQVFDYAKASETFVTGLIREKSGSMTLSELISNVESLNTVLKKELEKLATNWGVVVDQVVIQDIQIPETVLNAMHEQKAAVQMKLARIEQAAGHQQEIESVRSAAEQLNDRALAYYYIKALERLGESRSSKIIFPMELTNLARSISGGISHNQLETLMKKYAPIVKKIAAKGGK